MKFILEDVHGNQSEHEVAVGEGDKLIFQVTEEREQEEVHAVVERIRMMLSKSGKTATIFPHWLKIMVLRVDE